jgi:hypothetical protein
MMMSQPAVEQTSLFAVQALPVATPTHSGAAPTYLPTTKTPKSYGTKPLIPAPSFQAIGHEWTLTPAEREEVSHSITQTWTDQAIKCYMTGANCQRCDIPRGAYSFVCQMDKVVPVLLDTLGKPDVHRLKRVYPQGFSAEMHEAEDPAVVPACLR